MIDQLQSLVEDIISDHWMKLAWFVIAAVGLGAIKRWRDKRKWRLRQFLERVNCSLNIIDGGVLKIRTLFETSLGDILLANHGVPVKRSWYVFALSCEKHDDVRTQKIRVLLAQENLLKKIGSQKVPEPTFEAPQHHVRWKTLQQMAATYTAKPETFMRIELVLPNAPDIDEPLEPSVPSRDDEIIATESQ